MIRRDGRGPAADWAQLTIPRAWAPRPRPLSSIQQHQKPSGIGRGYYWDCVIGMPYDRRMGACIIGTCCATALSGSHPFSHSRRSAVAARGVQGPSPSRARRQPLPAPQCQQLAAVTCHTTPWPRKQHRPLKRQLRARPFGRLPEVPASASRAWGRLHVGGCSPAWHNVLVAAR